MRLLGCHHHTLPQQPRRFFGAFTAHMGCAPTHGVAPTHRGRENGRPRSSCLAAVVVVVAPVAATRAGPA
jgi:hypothetical protein